MRDEIGEALKVSLKARDARRTTALRAITAAIKDRDIAVRPENRGLIRDDEILALIQKMVKQREESEAIYAEAGRADLAAIERAEIEVLGEFLPRALSESELDAAISAAIAATGAGSIKDMGKVVGALKADYPGRIDFGKASGKVRAALSQ
jgi:uncharacterized protein YqeY